MKSNVTKRFIGLIVSLTMMLAYAVPFAHAADSISEETFWTFETLNPSTLAADTEVDGLIIHANAGKTVAVDESNKTIDGESFTVRAKMGGKMNSEKSERSFSFTPAKAGKVKVYYAHASSKGEARTLNVVQGENNVTDTVEVGESKVFETSVDAGTEVFIGSFADSLNFYGIKYTPSADGADPTLAPGSLPTDPPEEATQAPEETTAPAATTAPASNASVWVAKASDGDAIEPDNKGNTAIIPTDKNISSTADMEIYVMEELAYKDVDASFVDEKGNEVAKPDGMDGRLTKKPSGGTNPAVATKGAVGASMKIVPAKDGVLSAYVKVSSGTKHFIINDEAGNRVADYENTTAESIYVKVDANVTKGTTYYAYTEAAGTDYFGFAFEEKAAPAATAAPASNASVWVAKASDGEAMDPDNKGNTAMIPAGKNISSTADMEIYVMEDMAYKDVATEFVDENGESVVKPAGMDGRLTKKPSGGTNPAVATKGAVGASMKIVPAKDGVLSAYVKVSSGTKHFIINDEAGNRVADYENTTASSIYVKVDANVTKGTTYYAYTESAGTDYFGFAFEEKAAPAATAAPASNASVWTAKASDGDAMDPDNKGNIAMIPAGRNISSTADMEIYVMEDMAYKDVATEFVDENGESVVKPAGMDGRLTKKPSGGTNPTTATKGSVGASMKIVPAKDGVLSAYVKVSSGTKHFIINDEAGNRVADYENTTASSIYVKVDANVTKGTTYYAYTESAGTDYFGFAFEEKAASATTAPAAEAAVWTAKESDGDLLDQPDNKGNTSMVPAGKNISSTRDMEIYVMEDMPYKDVAVEFVDKDGESVVKPAGMNGRLTKKPSGGTNPTTSTKGSVGASMKIVPAKSGTLSAYVKVSSGTKHFIINDADGNRVADFENTTAGSLYVKVDAQVKAGVTYYAYTESAGTDYFGFALVEGEVDDPGEPAGPTQGPVVDSDLPQVTEPTVWDFEGSAGLDVTSTMTYGENNDMKIYGTSKMAVDGSNKTINGTKYTTRLKFGGTGQFAASGQPTGQVLEINPGVAGLIKVDFAHASSSGDPRALGISQNGYVLTTSELNAGATGSAEAYVEAGHPVYIYSTNLGAVNVYGVSFTIPEPTPTPGPTADPDSTPDPNATPTPIPENEPGPELDAAQAVYENLTLKGISDVSVYFDLDLVKDGKDVVEGNTSTITWESSDENYIKITEKSSTNVAASGAYRNYTGVVTRPTTDEECIDGGAPVTLTATIRNGKATLRKYFNVSVRKFNPYYYNDFQSDIGVEPDPDNKYLGIQDNVEAVNGDKFRGIRVVNFANSKAMFGFKHSDEDLEKNFDKRIMSTDEVYGKPRSLTGEEPEENFAFYYSMWHKYGGSTTYMPLWISLADEDGSYPEGLVMLNMDIYVITPRQQFSMGFGTSKPAQMCRFMLNAGNKNTNLGYDAGGTLRYFDAEEANDYLVYKDARGSNVKDYLVPTGKWIRATIVANADTHFWDFYFDGIQIAKSLKFRNAEDFIPTIEFTLARSYDEGSYLLDNITVENITEDYTGNFWDNFGLDTLSYDESAGAYVIDRPEMLPYQGTGGLAGSKYIWRSSNPSVLSVATTSIAADDLKNYGYTDEQIAAYKANKANYITGVVATPSSIVPETGTYVTLTASLDVNDQIYKKDFNVLVLPYGGSSQLTDEEKAKADLAALTCIKNGQTITREGQIDLEEVGPLYGSKITWETSDKSVITADGYVSRASKTQSAALTATATYNGVPATKKFTISVKGTSSSGSSGGGGGGGGGGSSLGSASRVIGTVSTPTETFETKAYTPEETANMIFNDIEKVPWAKEAIEALYEKGVVSGYGNGLYAPNYAVTREQFVKMLVGALGIDVNAGTDASFSDVDPSAWFAPYIKTAVAAGIVTGKEDGSFGVGEDITRQDMAVMCVRALSAVGKAPAAGEASFNDSSSISAYAKDAVGSMAAAGYLTGDERGSFNPKDTATRAQTAVVLYRIIK